MTTYVFYFEKIRFYFHSKSPPYLTDLVIRTLTDMTVVKMLSSNLYCQVSQLSNCCRTDSFKLPLTSAVVVKCPSELLY